MSEKKVSIIIPTFENKEILSHCLCSILNFTKHPHFTYVVVNGNPGLGMVDFGNKIPNVQWLTSDKHENLGYSGALNKTKDMPHGDYVLFLNDDTQVMDFDDQWLDRLAEPFKNPKIGAVGPVSNAVMGVQSVFFSRQINMRQHTAPVLSGFCLLVRKSVLDQVGWMDGSLPSGDDVDLSYRIRTAGYDLAVCRDVFILHRYGGTGRRVYGDKWDSWEHWEAGRLALIKKHGLKNMLNHEWEIANAIG